MTPLDRRLIELCNGNVPDVCPHHYICYSMDVQIPQKFRKQVVNSKAYLGHFSDLTYALKLHIEAYCERYQYILWERVCINPNTLKKTLVLHVTFYNQKRMYLGPVYQTFEIGMDSIGRFLILSKQKLPGDKSPWYYPLIHYPSFNKVIDLLVYIEYKSMFLMYNHRMINDIQRSRFKYRHYNKYECKNHCKNCLAGKTKTVRSLKNLTCCYIQTYSKRIAFDVEYIKTLLGVEVPPSLYEYLDCCINYIKDDGILRGSTAPVPLCEIK